MNSALRDKAEICALLNEFMYLEFWDDINEGETLADVLHRIETDSAYSEFKNTVEFQILKDNLDTIGDYTIYSPSWQSSDFNSGTKACTFQDPDSGEFYVVYKGTGDGEWPDNGRGMFEESTPQQEEAARYFDYVVEHNGLNEADNITVTGHSKGGNKSQYVTINS